MSSNEEVLKSLLQFMLYHCVNKMDPYRQYKVLITWGITCFLVAVDKIYTAGFHGSEPASGLSDTFSLSPAAQTQKRYGIPSAIPF